MPEHSEDSGLARVRGYANGGNDPGHSEDFEQRGCRWCGCRLDRCRSLREQQRKCCPDCEHTASPPGSEDFGAVDSYDITVTVLTSSSAAQEALFDLMADVAYSWGERHNVELFVAGRPSESLVLGE